MNTGVQISFRSPCFDARCTDTEWNCWSYGNSMSTIFLRNRKLFSMVASVPFQLLFFHPCTFVTQLVSRCHPRYPGMVLGSGDSRGTCSVRHTGTDNGMETLQTHGVGRPLLSSVSPHLPPLISFGSPPI